MLKQQVGHLPPCVRGRGSDDSYSGSIHKFGTKLFDNLLVALRKCEHLESFTWTEQADRLTTQPHEDPMAHSVADQSLRGVTKVIRELPITELTIRSYVGLSEEAWSELIKISGLKKLSLWCMEGQPRVLQGWSEVLGNTLTHLELGVSIILISSILLSDRIRAEVQRGSSDCSALGSLAPWSAERPQPPRCTQHSHPARLDVIAAPTISRHGLQPINCQGKTAGATSNFKTPRTDRPDNRRRRASQHRRMDRKTHPLSVVGILQAARFFRSR